MIVLVTYKCVIDQGSGKNDWTLQDIGPVLSFFVFLWTERGQYPAILPDKAWIIKDLLQYMVKRLHNRISLLREQRVQS